MASGNYRADHVGSLLPGARRDGGPDPGSVIAAVELQGEAVLDVFTDGEPWRLGVEEPGDAVAGLVLLRKLAPSWARLKLALSTTATGLAVEAQSAIAAGVDYLQVNAPALVEELAGGDQRAITAAQATLNQISMPEDATLGLYLGERAAGGLSALADAGRGEVLENLFTLPVDRFLIGFSAAGEADLSFVEHMPADRFLVMGIVDARSAELESPDFLLRKLDDAAAVHGDALAVCPSLGFADAPRPEAITLRVQRRKLELVSDVARMFWGTEL